MKLIAIDGRAGAGKTTLAARFFDELSVNQKVAVIHMDDLYGGWDGALGPALTQALGNIVKAHQSHSTIEYERFNWSLMRFDSVEMISAVDVLILEGVGAGQKIVRDAGAILYWIDVDAEIGIQRVLKRDGDHIAPQMKQWQIDQEIHFLSDKTRENAQHIQST